MARVEINVGGFSSPRSLELNKYTERACLAQSRPLVHVVEDPMVGIWCALMVDVVR